MEDKAPKLGFLGPGIYSGSIISALKLWRHKKDHFLWGMFWKPHIRWKPVNPQDNVREID